MCGVRDEFSRELPELGVSFFLARVCFDSEQARQDADDVAVEDWCGLIECDAANRASGVAANAGKREDVVVVGRKAPHTVPLPIGWGEGGR